MWEETAQSRHRTGAQDMEKCNVIREAGKDKMVLTRGEILGPLSGVVRHFEIRDALALEAHLTSYQLHWYHILGPFLPRPLPNTQINYGRAYKFRKLVKQHQPFSSFTALWVNSKRSMVHLGPLFFQRNSFQCCFTGLHSLAMNRNPIAKQAFKKHAKLP